MTAGQTECPETSGRAVGSSSFAPERDIVDRVRAGRKRQLRARAAPSLPLSSLGLMPTLGCGVTRHEKAAGDDDYYPDQREDIREVAKCHST